MAGLPGCLSVVVFRACPICSAYVLIPHSKKKTVQFTIILNDGSVWDPHKYIMPLILTECFIYHQIRTYSMIKLHFILCKLMKTVTKQPLLQKKILKKYNYSIESLVVKHKWQKQHKSSRVRNTIK